MSGPFRQMQHQPGDEFLTPARFEILEHGGVVHIKDDSMGIDMKEASVSAYLLRVIYHELRQLNITLKRIETNGMVG